MAWLRVERDVLCRPWTAALAFLKTVTPTAPACSQDDAGVDLATVPNVETRLHAEGAMGALFVMEKRDARDAAVVVLKANKATSTSSGGSTRRCLTDVCPYEVDITMFLWDLLATTGASLHVVCPYAVLRVVPPRALNFGSKPVKMLAMEKLTGIPTLDGTFVYNLQDLIVQGMKGRVVDFDVIFRTVLFQVLYTVTTWTYLTDGLFRHNDLYARNIGLSTFVSADDTASKLSYVVYTCRSRDAPYVKTTFAMETRLRAVVLDFGWSALLPKLGPRRDSRFFQQCRPGTQKAAALSKSLRVRPVVANSGMSQSLFSHHYDCTLLMVSCYMLILREPASRLPPVLLEFKTMYEATYSHIHESDMMHGEHLVGRLTSDAQALLNAGSKLTCKPRTTTTAGRRFDTFVVSVPHSREILAFPFFSCFRSGCSADVVSSICLGIDMGSAIRNSLQDVDSQATIRPTKAVVQTPTRQHTSKSPIAPALVSLETEFETGLWKQAFGCYDDLLAQASDIHERYRNVPVRSMTPDEAALWLSGSGSGSGASAAAKKKTSESVSATSEALTKRDGLKRCRKSDDDTGGSHLYDTDRKKKKPPCTTPCSGMLMETVFFRPITPCCAPVPSTAHFVSMTPL